MRHVQHENRNFRPTNIPIYLGNDGVMRSIEWCHFKWPISWINPDFKHTPLFDVEYFRNATRYKHFYNGILIGTHVVLNDVISNDLSDPEWLRKNSNVERRATSLRQPNLLCNFACYMHSFYSSCETFVPRNFYSNYAISLCRFLVSCVTTVGFSLSIIILRRRHKNHVIYS